MNNKEENKKEVEEQVIKIAQYWALKHWAKIGSSYSDTAIELSDLSQECCLIALEALDKYDEEQSSLFTYLTYQVLPSKICNWENRTLGIEFHQLSEEDEDEGNLLFDDLVASGELSTEELVDRELVLSLIPQVLNDPLDMLLLDIKLSDRELTGEEIGRHLGFSQQAVSKRYSKIVKKIRSALNDIKDASTVS